MPRLIARLGALLLAASATAFAADFPITAVPPLVNRAPTQKAEAPKLLLARDATARRVTLDPASEAEIAALRERNAASTKAATAPRTKNKRLAIGFAREVPQAARSIDLTTLDWHMLADGTRAARIEVESPGAEAVRVAVGSLVAPAGLTFRFTGTSADAPVFGPYTAQDVRKAGEQFGVYWSPVLGGSVAIIELAVPPGSAIVGSSLTLPQVSHSMVPPAELGHLSAKRLQDIGDSLPCEIDVACVTPQSTAFVSARNAVASIAFNQEDGGLYVCTGTLLNDSVADGVPYFFTANHCINSAYAAATINTYWFFDAITCGSNAVRPDWVQLGGGSKLLARSEDWDWALVQLLAPPPPGATYSAWRAEPVPGGADLTVLHHPAGDLKKFSQGTAAGYVSDGLYPGTTPATFLYMAYTQGETEGGSSGAGLLTFNGTAAYYELRGGLYNGLNAACPRPPGYFDVYSRFDNMLPVVRDKLTPGNNPAGTVTAVEFYNATLNHYFISTAAAEINDLDSGVHPGWVRTGILFNAYATPVAGTSPVCRFYRAPAYGDSHFYSASPAECAATAAAHPVDWIYESPAVFYIALPDPASGACPTGTRPLWRFFNQRTTNHRYTPEAKIRDELRSDPSTWIQEGYGPDAVIMCSPNGA